METILVVDDDRQTCDFLAGTVLPSLGYQTLATYSGKAAIETVRKHHPHIDLLLLDYQLPDMTGLDILQTLLEEGRSIPAILITAHGSEDIAVDAMRLDVHDYLSKPVDVDFLGATVNRVLTTVRLQREKERLTRQLEEQVTWLTALSSIGKSLTSTLDIDEVLRRIVEAGVNLTRAEEGFLALLEPEGDQLYLRAVKNLDEKNIKTMRLPVIDTMIGKVMQLRRPLRATRKERQPLKVSTGFLVQSLLHVPILSKDEALGVLSVYNRHSHQAFTAMDEAKLVSLADYAAVALENANLYQQARQEIQDRKLAEQALKESEARYALAVLGANDGIWDWDLQAKRLYYSTRWKMILGYSEDEIGNNPDEWFARIHPEDRQQVMQKLQDHIQGLTPHFESEHRLRHKRSDAGEACFIWVHSRGIAVRDQNGSVYRMAGSLTDITNRKRIEQKLLYDALHDHLTGLLNRASLLNRLSLTIERHKRNPKELYAVLFMDLDRFKDVNDTLGHQVGDQLVVSVGRLLKKIVRPTDAVARMGGDEYVILLEDIKDIRDAIRVAERVKIGLGSAQLLPGYDKAITASIGIVLATESGPKYQQPEEILRDADIAMYRAKNYGKDRYEIYDPVMREHLLDRLSFEAELLQALEKSHQKDQEFFLEYQPIVSFEDGKLLGFEALVRWKNPKRGLLHPNDFIQIAENAGLMVQIDRWVLVEALGQFRAWMEQIPGMSDLTMDINISSRHLLQKDFLQFIDGILAELNLQGNCLSLELSDSAVLRLEKGEFVFRVLDALKDRGIHIQVEDFGADHASLSYLSRYPLDALKIDRQFIHAMQNDPAKIQIVQAIIQLTHRLGIEVIAEGVETIQEWQQLKAMGCSSVQGYWISIPQDEQAIGDLLQKIFVSGELPWNINPAESDTACS